MVALEKERKVWATCQSTLSSNQGNNKGSLSICKEMKHVYFNQKPLYLIFVKECSLSLQTKATITEKGRLFTLTRNYCTHICKEIYALTSAFYKVRLYGDVAFSCLVDNAGFPEVDTPPPFEGYIEPHVAGGAGRVLLEEFKCFDNL